MWDRELRNYARSGIDELDGFFIKMQTLDDTITDFTPPISGQYVQDYEKRFHHEPVWKNAQKQGTRVHVAIHSLVTMPKRRRTTVRRRKRRQKGGIFPLAALLPALIAGGKAVALGAVPGAAGYGAKKALKAATQRRR